MEKPGSSWIQPLSVFKWVCVGLVAAATVIGFRYTARSQIIICPVEREACGGRARISNLSLTTARPGPPVQHVYYLKIHKTGSSTIYSILSEYCRSHDLLPLLPLQEHINQETPLLPQQQLMLSPQVQFYDMVFNHHVYDPAILKYLHKDSFKFTMLREPFSHFVSSFNYFKERMDYLKLTSQYKDPISTFLEQPSAFEAEGFKSYTNNRQSIDLGYDIRQFSFSNESYLQNFINETEKRFDLILINEYFIESIVLLKRALNWQTQDVLFFVKNALPKSHVTLASMTEWHRERHRNFSQPDIQLYEHFLSVFKQRMSQTVGLQEEVSELRDILTKVRNFCSVNFLRNMTNPKEVTGKLEIPTGRWSGRISLLRPKCKWLKINEWSMTKILQISQRWKLENM